MFLFLTYPVVLLTLEYKGEVLVMGLVEVRELHEIVLHSALFDFDARERQGVSGPGDLETGSAVRRAHIAELVEDRDGVSAIHHHQLIVLVGRNNQTDCRTQCRLE